MTATVQVQTNRKGQAMTNNSKLYRNPPAHSRFQPGVSGNPTAKKKGTRNLATEIAEELAAETWIDIGGQKKTVSKQRALAISLISSAIAGDLRATALVLAFCERQAAKALEASEDTEVID